MGLRMYINGFLFFECCGVAAQTLDEELNSRRVGCMVAIRREERQSLHQLIALRDWDVAVVELTGGLAIHVEPPVALEDSLVEQRGFWTEEALHHQAVVCECADVKHL